MSDDLKVTIGGDASGAHQALQSTTDDAKKTASEIARSNQTAAESYLMIRDRIIGVGTAIAGMLAALKNAVALSVEVTRDAIRMGQALGVSASEAGALAEAFDDAGVSQETYEASAQHLQKALHNTEDALNQMGLKTRDANGELRNGKDLMLDAIGILGQYKEGTDRTQAAMVLFGKGSKEANELLRLTKEGLDEATASQAALGMTITKEGVERYQEYRKASNEAKDVLEALKNQVGQALMPVLTAMGKWLGEVGPTLVQYFRAAIKGLSAEFYVLRGAAMVVGDSITAAFQIVGRTLGGTFAALDLAVHGDVPGALAVLKALDQDNAEILRKTNSEIRADVQRTAEAVGDAYASILDHETPAGMQGPAGSKSYKAPIDSKAAADKKLKEEADLARAIESNRQHEAAFDRQMLDQETAQLIAQIQDQQALSLGQLNFKRQMSQLELQGGEITKAQMLQREIGYEDERDAIERGALDRQIALLDTGTAAYQKALDQRLLLQQQHDQKLALLSKELVISQKSGWQELATSMRSGLEGALGAMLRNFRDLRAGVNAALNQLLNQFLGFIAKKVVAWVFGETAQTAATAAGATTRTGIEASASSTSVLLSAGATIKKIAMAAYEAMAKAFASAMALPFPVNLAVAGGMVALAGATVFGFAKGISSAEGGFDIPAGVNPMTQLHQKEMVLPAKYADVIRGMGEGGGGGGDIHLNIYSKYADARGIQKMFDEHVVPALKRQARDFKI